MTTADVMTTEPTRLERFEKRAEPWMLALGLLFLPLFLLSLMPGLSTAWLTWVDRAMEIIYVLFLAEFVTRFVLASCKRTFLRRNWVEVLMLAVPFLRAFRVVRALRGLARAGFAIAGMTMSARALHHTRRLVRDRGVLYAFLLVGFGIVASAVFVLHAEDANRTSDIHSLGDALWWAVSTVTTVGYGDRVPQTTMGRWVAVMLMVLGLGLLSVVTARIAAFFGGDDHLHDETTARLEAMNERLARIEALLAERRDREGE
jgi:voltage-gated potassium channel